MLLLYAIAGLIFASVSVLIIGYMQESRTARLQERMEKILAPQISPGSPIAQELQRSFYERAIYPVLSKLGERVVQLTPGGAVESSRKKLEMAGNPASLTAATFMVLRAISLAAGVLGALAVLSLWRESATMHRMFAGGLLLFVGGALPGHMLDSVIRSRQYLITKSMPDLIDLLVVSAEAGTGLDGALAEVVRRKDGPLPDEFNRVLTEVRLGKRRNESWQDMADRCGVDDMTNLVAALHQAEELGVSIANTLRTQADALRTRRSMRIRTAAATMSTKMLFPLIFFIFPSLFVVVLGPGVLTIQDAFRGLGW